MRPDSKVFRLFAALLIMTAALAAPAETAKNGAPVLDRANMDPALRPGEDFYRYANGRWIKALALPEDKSSYDSFTQVRDQNRERLRELFESLAASSGSAVKGSAAQKVGDFYAAAMDAAKAEALGAMPLSDDLARIAALTSIEELQDLVAEFHSSGLGVLFGSGVLIDLKDAKIHSFYLGQGGLGMPDRDDYLKEDADSAKLRLEYLKHVSAMLQLLGDGPELAAGEARTIMDIETRLAQHSKTRLELRDLPALYNKRTLAELQAQAPGLDWTRYLARLGGAGIGQVIVTSPDFFREAGLMLAEGPWGG